MVSIHPAPDQKMSESRVRLLDKLPTHIPGLDLILDGGIPEDRMTILSGGPGSGKTMLALEIFYRNAAAGTPGLMVCFEEGGEAVRINALTMGWDLNAMEEAGKLAVIHPEIDYRAIRGGEFSIEGLLAVLAGKAQEIGARFILIDALDVLLRLFNDPERQMDECWNLNRWLNANGMTALVTAKLSQSFHSVEKYDFLDYLADCVIYLDQRIDGQVMTRRLRVVKYRGSGYSSNEHPFIITRDGLVLMPVTSAALNHKPLGQVISAGMATLDRIMGGGYRQGSTVLISGPTGSGKTTFSSLFTQAACRRGERVQYVSFEESPETLIIGMKSMNIDLAPHVAEQNLRFLTAMPEAMGVEEHLYRIFSSMEEFRPSHHIVDAVSAAVRMGSEKAAFNFMVRLMDECKKNGITCIYTNQTSSRAPVDEISGVGISSLMDTAVILDYDRKGDIFGRSVLALKSRGASHSHRFHRFQMTDQGILMDEDDDGAGGDAR